jgi:hypothetical protein
MNIQFTAIIQQNIKIRLALCKVVDTYGPNLKDLSSASRLKMLQYLTTSSLTIIQSGDSTHVILCILCIKEIVFTDNVFDNS